MNQSYYYGSTENIEKRLQEHNSGFGKYTSKYAPWELVYFECFETRSEAVKREKYFKTGVGREFIKNKLNN